MEPISLAFALSAFLAGIIIFLAPCTLPLVPGYLSFISGASISDLQNPEKAKKTRGKIFLNGVFYVIGFSAVFILFGTLLGLGGSFLFEYRSRLIQIGGGFVVFFGLFLLFPALAGITNGRINLMKYPPLSFLAAEKHVRFAEKITPGNPLSSFLFGVAFALGWSPCLGPILGGIFTLAASSATVGQGTLLLFIFSAGLAMPFLITALAVGWASTHFKNIVKYLNWVSLVGSIFLILLGYMMITGDFSLLNSLLFGFLGNLGLEGYESSLRELL